MKRRFRIQFQVLQMEVIPLFRVQNNLFNLDRDIDIVIQVAQTTLQDQVQGIHQSCTKANKENQLIQLAEEQVLLTGLAILLSQEELLNQIISRSIQKIYLRKFMEETGISISLQGIHLSNSVM